MVKVLTAALAAGLLATCAPAMNGARDAATYTIPSPDGRVSAAFHLDPAGAPHYNITLAGRPALADSRLGLRRADADFNTGLRLRGSSAIEPVEDHYEVLGAKRRHNVYRANRQVFHLEDGSGRRLNIVFQVSNDGVAFRYVFPDTSAETHELREEVTSFHFLPGTRAWLQPMQVVKTGWGDSNPAYEEYYQQDIPVGTPSTLGAGWVYPALFCSGDVWLLVSETGLDRNYAGTRLRHESPDGEYFVGFPDPRETRGNGPVQPTSTLPWASPWRIIAVGELKTIAESMLGIDLALPPAVQPAGPIVPGKAAWSWPLLGDRSIRFETQQQFIDYAADMGWQYVLVDNYWDRQIGFERMQQLIEYARPRGVRIMVWYNSAGPWNTTPQTPRNELLTHESRIATFERLKQLGVTGLKIDFFGADGQDMIAYYHDIMTDAAPYGFLLNFHGATLPRGWSRTYPHLMTVEAVKGLEFATFEQVNADQVPAHAAMLPFTRNVFDPMDFTPLAMDGYPRTERRTTAAAELAQSVLFTSGIQHYAETPAGMAKAPGYVRDFLRALPDTWDDSRFLDGFPGRYVVFARRAGERWFIAGLNADTTEREVTLELREIAAAGRTLTLITDGSDALGFTRRELQLPASRILRLTLAARGGFVAY